MACRFCDNIQKSYPNKRLRVFLFFRYPISVCRFSLGYWQRSLFTHQPPVVPQSQPGKQCWKWLVWVRPSKSLWEGSTAPNSPLHTSSIQSFSFYYTEIYKWQGAEIWGSSAAVVVIGCLLPAIFTDFSDTSVWISLKQTLKCKKVSLFVFRSCEFA